MLREKRHGHATDDLNSEAPFARLEELLALSARFRAEGERNVSYGRLRP